MTTRIRNISILSKEMDGAGYYYGWYRECFVNVKFDSPYYVGFVDDQIVTATARSKQQAESMCKEYIDLIKDHKHTPDKSSRMLAWVLLIAISLLVVLAPLMFR